MATVTRFVRGGKTGDNSRTAHVIDNVLDFSLLNVSAADVVHALELEAGTLVLEAGIKVITAEGATATGTLGDSDSATTYMTAQNLNSTSTDGAGSAANPVYHPDADYINLVPAHDLDNAKVYVWAVVVQCIPPVSEN